MLFNVIFISLSSVEVNHTELVDIQKEFYEVIIHIDSTELKKLMPYFRTTAYHLPCLLDNHGDIDVFDLQGIYSNFTSIQKENNGNFNNPKNVYDHKFPFWMLKMIK